jgi:hypothetical protein
MIKLFGLITFTILFSYGCNESNNIKKLSTIEELKIESAAKASVDSLIKESARKVLFDTGDVSSSPIKVLSATMYSEEYSNFRDIRLKIQNVSAKQIVAARFSWYGENAFGEPADMGGVSIMSGSEGFGGGFSERIINPNKTATLSWDINSRDGKKVIKAWAKEVVFSDGTKWKSSNN